MDSSKSTLRVCRWSKRVRNRIETLSGTALKPEVHFRSVLRCELHPFLLLSLIAEPHADHVLFQVELFRDRCDFLATGPWLYRKVRLQTALFRRRNWGPLPLFFTGRKHTGRVRISSLVLRLGFSLLQPRLQDRLQGDHVVVGQGERLEPANRRLRKGAHTRKFQVRQRFAHVRLGYSQLDPSLLESGNKAEI